MQTGMALADIQERRSARRRIAGAGLCWGLVHCAATLPGSGSDDRGDGDHYARRDHDDARVRLNSLLGMLPGSSGVTFGMQPGRDDCCWVGSERPAPRVPTAITMPGGTYQGPQTNPAIGRAATASGGTRRSLRHARTAQA